MTEHPLWPRYAEPADLPDIESVPLAERALPESTYALLARAARSWPERTAVTVLPEAGRWREPLRRNSAQLLADVHRYANLRYDIGVRRDDAVALLAPNCAELIPATLAAQLAGSPPRSTVSCPSGTSPNCCGAPEHACSSRPDPRAAATRRESLDALARTVGVRDIAAAAQDGAIVATVVLDHTGDESAVAATLGRHAIEWKVEACR